MRHRWILTTFLVAALAAIAEAKPGLVLTKDGNVFDGDVTENPAAGTVDIMVGGITTTVKRSNVSSIVYPDVVAADVRRQLRGLKKDDVPGRVALAQRAMDAHAYEAARDVLQEAASIDPSNFEVRGMLENVQRKLRPAVATSSPTSAPAPTTAPVADVPPPRSGHAGTAPVPKRMLTADEINRLREIELGKDETNVRIKIDPETRKRYLASTGMSLSDFNAMSPVQQAYTLINSGKDYAKGVHILSDPLSMATFRKETNKVLVAGCAATACHGAKPVGNFLLFPQQDNEPAVFSNYVIVQRYTLKLKDRVHLMVNRQDPQDSLLLQYLLPPELSDVPHPDHTGYRGVARNHGEVRFRQVEHWLSDTLPLPGPDYSQFDLSKPPTTQPAPTEQRPEAGAMTPGGMLSLTLLVTAGAALADRINRRRRWRVLRLLAGEWRMNFSPYDQLRLSPKIARLFPIPGAANLKVRDVIYGTDGEFYRYVFTAEFTVGVVRTKHRWTRAASFSEPRNRESAHSEARVTLAPADLPWLEQYRHLIPPAARAAAASPL